MSRTSPPFNIVFAGTPEFAAVALSALLDSPHRVVAVYTQPDRPAGRGRQLRPSPVKSLALQHGIAVEQPVSLTDPAAQAGFKEYAPDIAVVAAYGLLLPEAILNQPAWGCINIHASLLPRWRGAAPIQRALLAGDSQTGITIMQMDAGLDTGSMLLKAELAIEQTDNAGSLHDRLAELGARTLVQVLADLPERARHAEPQNSAQACYAKKLHKEEAWIDWSAPAIHIDRQIRAFNPWPIAQTRLDDTLVRIWQAEPVLIASTTSEVGTLLDVNRHGMTVACGEQALRLVRCQLPGGKPLSIAQLLNGHPDLFTIGAKFR